MAEGCRLEASKCSEKSLYQCHFVQHYVPTWNNGLESNPVLCNERLANTSLSQRMAELFFNFEIKRGDYEYCCQ